MKRAVAIADDHPVIRLGLRALLASSEEFMLAGEAADGVAALAIVRNCACDLLVLDLSIPGRGGLELIKLVKAERPRLPILVFTEQREEMYAVRAIRAGASGYVSKKVDTDSLLAAMHRVMCGSVHFSQAVAEMLSNDPVRGSDPLPHMRLTDREYGIFSRIVSGAKLTDIAGELSLSIKTVSTHKYNILDKMTLASPAELVRYAVEHKLLDDVRS